MGAHGFTLYDESAMGRYDGENHNIGFVDVCHRVHEPLADAARLSHAQLHETATERIAPGNDTPSSLNA